MDIKPEVYEKLGTFYLGRGYDTDHKDSKSVDRENRQQARPAGQGRRGDVLLPDHQHRQCDVDRRCCFGNSVQRNRWHWSADTGGWFRNIGAGRIDNFYRDIHSHSNRCGFAVMMNMDFAVDNSVTRQFRPLSSLKKHMRSKGSDSAEVPGSLLQEQALVQVLNNSGHETAAGHCLQKKSPITEAGKCKN